jgi:ADP-ribose pyrophosphatase YjhB (NUDIX family)
MRHLKNVCAVIKNEVGEVFVCKRKPEGENASKWEFPTDKLRDGISIEMDAVRVVFEKLKTMVYPERIITCVDYTNKEVERPYNVVLQVVECKVVKGKLVLDEYVDSKWVKVEDLDSLDLVNEDKEVIASL